MNQFLRSMFGVRRSTFDVPPLVSASLPEDELRGALAVPAENPQYRATCQILLELEREAIEAARTTVANPGMLASFTGGGEWIARALAKLEAARQEGNGEKPE